MNKEKVPSSPRLRFRPPDFLLPHGEGLASRRADNGPDIYISWDGNVYGPASAEDVLAGIQASSFKDDAQFWFEGQEDWMPLATFTDFVEFSDESPGATAQPPAFAQRTLPTSDKRPRERRRKNRHCRSRQHKSSKLGRQGRIVVIFFAILSALLTSGLISLLMLI